MIQEKVERYFDKYVKRIFAEKHEVRDFILNHHGKRKCIDSTATELRLAELRQHRLINDKVIREVTKASIKLFAHQALHLKENEILSQNALLTKEKKERKAEDFQKEIDAAEFAETENFEG